MFFKEIKQTLQLADFMGYNENAVRWQIWIARLVYLLLRFLAWRSKWKHSFTRLFTLIRGVVWKYLDLWRCAGLLWDSTWSATDEGSTRAMLPTGIRTSVEALQKSKMGSARMRPP